MQFSANLGFLFKEYPLPESIRAAAKAGFDAVECHFPYAVSANLVKQALEETNLPMISLNTVPGDLSSGEFGLAVLPDRKAEAVAAIDNALEYAVNTGTRNIHVLAGKGDGDDCRKRYIEHLGYAADQAANFSITILIEPINHRNVPNYFLWNMEQAVSVVRDVNVTNLKILFDCYHVQIMQGNLLTRFEKFQSDIGHVQIASVPHRNEPDSGEIDYRWFLKQVSRLGYQGYVGAEYHPLTSTEAGLDWLSRF